MNAKRKLPQRIACHMAVLLAAVLLLFSANAQAFDVEGHITDPDNKPLNGVIVTVYQHGGRSQSATSDSDGHYIVSLQATDPIDQIRYTLTDWDPGQVRRLSGKRNQKISKIMYRNKDQRSKDAMAETLDAYEWIAFETLLASGEQRTKMESDLRERRLGELMNFTVLPTPKAPVDRMLFDKIIYIKKIYEENGWLKK